jgi:hypothetical protein
MIEYGRWQMAASGRWRLARAKTERLRTVIEDDTLR